MTNPWFKRGGNFNNGTGAGVLYFNRNNGNANSNNGSRVVLAYYDIMKYIVKVYNAIRCL